MLTRIAIVLVLLAPGTILADDRRFDLAQRLFERGRYEEAAPLYLRSVNANPTDIGGNNDKRLNNAAVCFEKTSRFDEAAATYERLAREYPKSEFALDAVFRGAFNRQRAFHFQEAANGYLRLVADRRFHGTKHHFDSMWNAANLLGNLGRSIDAANWFERYAKESHGPAEYVVDAWSRAATEAINAGNGARAIGCLRALIARIPVGGAQSFDARIRLAEALRANGQEAAALDELRRVAAETMKVPDSLAKEQHAHADFAIAEAALTRLLPQLAGFAGLPIALAALHKEVVRVEHLFQIVIDADVLHWTVGASVRAGDLSAAWRTTVERQIDSPCPAAIRQRFRDEGCEVYQRASESTFAPIVERATTEATTHYRRALDAALIAGETNEWTERAAKQMRALTGDAAAWPHQARVDAPLDLP